jgi:hypothetical protein
MTNIRVGDIILFDGQGCFFHLLSFLLGLFDKDWRTLKRKPWHVGFISRIEDSVVYICEAREPTVRETVLDTFRTDYQVVHWLESVDQNKVREFVNKAKGKRYDIAIYFWTSLAIIIRHFFNHRIPKLLDERFDCWELIAEFCDFMNRPIVSKYDTIIITDLVKALNVSQ